MTGLILNHLWQSTLFAAMAWLLTLALRGNGAQTRFWVWFAASVKFLVPFAALTAIGSALLTPTAPPISAPVLLLMQPAAQPFSTPLPLLSTPMLPAAPHFDILALLLPLWALGFCVIAVRWTRRQMQLHRLLQAASELPLPAPVMVKSAPSPLEPGLVGIWRPVILLPQGIAEQLSGEELDAIMAHELCHLRRHDNLLAAIHMFVEALFWFHPLVWWLGRRMIAERERACDESVLASGKSPKLYAESILKVCKLYLHSPLTCAAGVSGADLKQRLEEIVENKIVHRLRNTKKALLAAAALLAVGAPIALGLVQAPPARAQPAAAGQAPAKPYTGPLPNKVKLDFTAGERTGNPLSLTLLANTCKEQDRTKTRCEGDVALSMPAGIATSDAVTWDPVAQKITLTGKVVLFAGMNRLNGASMVMDESNGVIHMNGQDVKSGYPGRHLPAK